MAVADSIILKKIYHVRHTVLKLLKDGIAPKKLAWSITCGIVVGLFPVIGATTILTFAFSVVFRLNIVAVQLVNWLMTPLHLLCLIPFLKLGELLTGAKSSALSIENLKAKFANGFWEGLQLVFEAQLLAILAWGLIALPLTVLLFTIFHRLFRLHR
ncbi:MAG: DUF2062 domain-containing protein [Bacteroidia bacterium]|nr:DUF2062 domain-containing protein [Bacteroidia bacterium]